MIDGVAIKTLKVIPDERGRLMEILRSDDDIFAGFGQVYITTTYPRVVKAWHYHRMQDDFIACVRGMIKLVLEEAIIVNTPTMVYNYAEPDEFRIDPHDNDIPYTWERRDG